MTLYVAAFLLGILAGLRTMTAPPAVSWAAALGILRLSGTPLAFLGATITPWLFTAAALAELVADQLPQTPSRKVPVQFAARILMGGLAGGAVGLSVGALLPGVALGVLGAVAGTYGGAAARARMAAAFGRDRPAALIEDRGAAGGAAAIIWGLL